MFMRGARAIGQPDSRQCGVHLFAPLVSLAEVAADQLGIRYLYFPFCFSMVKALVMTVCSLDILSRTGRT